MTRWISVVLLAAACARPMPVTAPASGWTVRQDAHALAFAHRGRTLLVYQARVPGRLPRADIPEVYRRGGYIQRLFTPAGRQVLDDYPPDHLHHYGVWFAWVKSRFAGHETDFWNVGEGKARVDFVAVDRTFARADRAGFVARHRHSALAGNVERAVLDETWAVTLNAPTARHFAVDLSITLTNVADEPLQVLEHRYGGLGVRGHRGWAGAAGAAVLTSLGDARATADGSRPRWTDMTGPVDGALAGIAVVDHPDNLRAPQPVRVHPDEPYFSLAPARLGAFALAPGEPFVARYRLVVHDGPADPRALSALSRAGPSEVRP